MTTLLENPMPVIFVGIVLVAALAIVYVSNRNNSMLLAIGAVLVLVLAFVALEAWVVTDVERVEAALEGTAAALEANDLELLFSDYVSASAGRTQARAQQAHSLVEINSAKMNNLTVTINRLTSPATARAEFRGVFHFEPKDRYVTLRHYQADFIVELRLEDGRWKITDHVEHHDIR